MDNSTGKLIKVFQAFFLTFVIRFNIQNNYPKNIFSLTISFHFIFQLKMGKLLSFDWVVSLNMLQQVADLFSSLFCSFFERLW